MIMRSSDDIRLLVMGLRYLRGRQKMTVAQVAERMGSDPGVVYDVERRGTNSMDLLIRYAEAIGAPLEINLHGKSPSH